MDKGWMKAPRSTNEFREGVKRFIEFGFVNSAEHNRILCPCKVCRNAYWLRREEVFDHLVFDGFMAGYTSWIHHGEGMWSADPVVASSSQSEDGSDSHDDIDRMLLERFGMYDNRILGGDDGLKDELDIDADTYYKLVNDASRELYPGCKFSNLQFLVRLLNIKNIGGVSDDCFDELLSLIKDALPDGVALPKNFYDAKKFVKAIGVSYECIDACPNDCILFRGKKYEDAKSCPVCHASRWKSEKVGLDGRRVHRVPQKVVRHFPLKKRLQRLFMSSKTAPLMRWHEEGRTKDGLLRHPADSPAWKHFDAEHKDYFKSEIRNVRLGLATDGFNPFGRMSVSYSIWPIFLIPYNLPPWMCMKQSNFILSVLIPGKRAPGKDMDVYMQLTIDDLMECWRGFMTLDVSRSEKFLLRAALLWTISDWIGRGCLSGESLSACSHCLTETCSLRLKHGHKTCYMGHRRFLDTDHRFRFQARSFDGTQELRERPVPLSGHEISELTKDMKTVFGKTQKTKNNYKRKNNGDEEGDERDISSVFKKRGCLFQLPYWETLLVRHNLDFMHIQKNVFDNLANTLLGIDKKSKDNLNARLDLKEMGIRPDLHPSDLGNNKSYIPPALYTMGPKEKKLFCEVLKGGRFPDGYASNLHNKVRVDEKRLIGLKTHDCHIIMQDLLPLAIRSVLPERVCIPLIKLSNYFKKLCSKVISASEMQKLEAEIPEIICLLEKVFPPTFFDIMVHLTIHLATEVMLAGPVHYRNMYPVERLLYTMKNIVRSQSHPEGSIAEGWLFHESLTFCSQYLHGCETKLSRVGRHSDSTGPTASSDQLMYLRIVGRPLSGSCAFELDNTSWIQAQRYVLVNYPDISSYVEKHLHILASNKRLKKRDVERIHHKEFHNWFPDYKEIKSQLAANPSLIGEEAHDGDVFSGLFPKERSGRWRGLGLLVGGRASKELAEVKAELQETKNENMRLWSVINALQKNQSALQEQHNELKAMLLASHDRVPAQSDQKIVQEPKDPPVDNQDKETPVSPGDSKIAKVKAEFVEKMTMSTKQTSKDHLVDNQEKETAISDSKISKVEFVEKKTRTTQQASKKGQPTQQMEKAPNLQQKRKIILSDKDMHKKPRKFQTPLQKGELAVLKRGLEVGLISPQSTSMVAFATIQATDKKSKATDGQTLNDCVEVLVNTVFSKTTQLPHSQGNIKKLAAAVGRCVRWPRKNLEPLHDGSGDRQPPKEYSDKA